MVQQEYNYNKLNIDGLYNNNNKLNMDVFYIEW